MKDTLLTYTQIFCKEIGLLLLIAFTFLTPIYGLLGLISFAVVFDTLFAIYTVIKIQGLKFIISTKLFNLVVKTFFYMFSIIFAFIIDVFILEEKLFEINYPISKFICVFWLLIEIKSIDETSQKLGNRPFLNILNDLIKKAKRFKKDLNELKD